MRLSSTESFDARKIDLTGMSAQRLSADAVLYSARDAGLADGAEER